MMDARGGQEDDRMTHFVSGLAVAFALTLASMPAVAQQQPPERYISVTGEGEVHVVPNLAIIHAGVTTQGKTARTASDANGTAMAKVIAALKASGIAERDVQTSQFSIRPLFDSRRDGDNRITGFQATNRVSAKVRDITKVAAVLDQVISAGANDLSGIEFTVSEHSKLLDRARSDAVADARRKAELLAKAAGVKLGPAMAVVENGGAPPAPMERMRLRAAPAAAPPVAAGEQTLQVSVSVTFGLTD
jgi:hypothetical protein